MEAPLTPHDWDDYALLDSGGGRKLERFGHYVLASPEPEATWQRALPEDRWIAADAVFEVTDAQGNGVWRATRTLPARWTLHYRDLAFAVQAATSRHVGIFPENAPHWDWIEAHASDRPWPLRVMNLFGYTGLATLAAAHAGASVTHVDAARQAVTQARENASLSGLADRPIRWIVDDALKFTRREARRGVRYDGIVLDPPAFGRGPKGELWTFATMLDALIEACRAVLNPRPTFVVLTAYGAGVQPAQLRAAVATLTVGHTGTLEAGRLGLREQSAGRVLPGAAFARWAAAGVA